MVAEINHRGNPVMFGAEKEHKMSALASSGADRLDLTQPTRWEPALVPHYSPDMFDAGAAPKAGEAITWKGLNDNGKQAWITAYRAKYGADPEIIVDAADKKLDRIDWEHTGELEVVSDVFTQTKDLSNWLKEHGWGHITTSFMRGMPAEERKEMLSFVALANLYVFSHGLEARGADVGGEKGWRFVIKPLGIPTEEHIKIFDGIFDKNRLATAFSKHNQVNIRGSGKYGDPNRIAFEVRAGDSADKARVQNAIFNSLKENKWGAAPFQWGTGKFRLVKLGLDVANKDPNQVKSLPADFRTLAAEIKGVDGATADRIYQFVSNARFADEAKNARITQFDQRACIPLLAFGELPGFDAATKARLEKAQQNFVRNLDGLAKKNLDPKAAAGAISDAIVTWAKEAQISDALGRWIDGPPGRQQYV